MGYKDGILFMMGLLALLMTCVLLLLIRIDQSVRTTEERLVRVEVMTLGLQVAAESGGKQLDRLAAWKEVDEMVDGLSRGK